MLQALTGRRTQAPPRRFAMDTLTSDLTLATGDRIVRFPAIWLRDNCPCGACKDPQTGQKLFGITDIPAAVAVASIEEAPDSVVVVYAPDGHRSTFARSWLIANTTDGS